MTLTDNHNAVNEKKRPRGHPFGSVQRPVPAYSNSYQTPLQSIANALQITSDKQLQQALGYRVSASIIRDWRRGKARVPAWVWDALAPLISERRNRLAVAANIIEIEQRKTRQNEAG